ncbi:MAG: hypothetical protein J6A69_07235 [Clostridia bacterium]|nr:hypothetical protein [Clostridia bacterium]
MAYNDYNPYSDVLGIYNAKVGYNKATTDEERKRQNEIATAARKNLEAYGYKDVAEQLSATGADTTAARKILEQYKPITTATPTTPTNYTDAELIKKNNNEVNQKVNQLWGTQANDRQVMTGKYNKLEDTAYANPFETEEGKAIIGKFDLDALQGRNNEVASGAGSNGGNVDSFAAANALRQQAALTAKGQMVALDAHNNKINNVKSILSDLGVYLQNQDKGMQNTIGLQSNEGQRLFENDLAEKATMAEITGYVPNEWTIKNDAVYNEFLNPDGTFKTEKEGVDIQALINQTNDPATKQKLAVVRAKKALGNLNKYGQYLNQGDIAFMENQKTEAADQFDKNDATVRETLKAESADTRYGIDAEKQIAAANNQNAIDQIKAQTEGEKEVLTHQVELSGGAGADTLSEDAEKVAKQIQEKINKYSQEKYGVDVMDYKGRGTYGFNLPKGHVTGWWDDIVIKEILESPLTTDEKYILINQLGFGELLADFNLKYKQDENGKVVNK